MNRSLRSRLRGMARGRRGGSSSTDQKLLSQLDDHERRILAEIKPYTMTGPERQLALLDAVQHVVDAGIPGAFAECGVWQGGSVLAMIRVLQANGVSDRDLYLYDTFEGMTRPAEVDTTRYGDSALTVWERAEEQSQTPWWWWFDEQTFNLEDVRRTLVDSGYPEHRLHFVQGKVEDTIPEHVPDRLALLRLDTDWYESTRHELEHLYPLLSPSGVLLIDDYGHWDGCRKAVEEYFADPTRERPLLQRIDYTARIAVKPREAAGDGR